jgi:transcriptional regulator with XRE-family HTH domain
MANKTNVSMNFEIGLLLQKARESKGITQREIAEHTGFSKNHISDVERGLSKASVELLLGYCEILDLDANTILAYTVKKA